MDRNDNEWKAIINDESTNGNASLVYAKSEDDEFTVNSLHMAINIPNEEDAVNAPYYKHRPNAKWPQQVL